MNASAPFLRDIWYYALPASQLVAGRTLAKTGLTPRRLVLISDLQDGAHLDGLQGFEWPRGLEVVLEPLKPKRPTNAGLSLVLEQGDKEKPARQEALRGSYDPEYLYYTLGKLQFLKLRRDWEKQEGTNYSLEKFHDECLRHGMPPLRLLREIMLKDARTWDETF